MRNRIRRLSFVSILAGALAGCGGDPATQEPVKLQPGLYEATLDGRAYGPFYASAPAALEKRSCVTADEVDTFPQSFTRKYLSMEGHCGGPLAERAGNLITGKVTCPIDEDGVTGDLETTFKGTVSERSVDVAAVTKLKDLQGDAEEVAELEATPLKEGIDLRLTISRVGDCAD